MKKNSTGRMLKVWVSLLAMTVSSMAGTFIDLHDFTGSGDDGANPNGVLLNNGLLFGVASQGGSPGNGQVFRLGTNGMGYTPLRDFAGFPTDGSTPNELLQAGATLYGTTYLGGIGVLNGIVFKVDTNGNNYTILRSFAAGAEPQFPLAALTISGSMLYGTSLDGGTSNVGTIFEIDTNGNNFAVIHAFTNNPDGANPRSRLWLNGSTLYGTTSVGGTNGAGTVFKVNTDGSGYAVLYSFSNAPDANQPYVGLSQAGNMLYGVAGQGGISNAGALFQIGLDGSGYAVIHSFTNSDGISPQSPLLVNGSLYGTTLIGGAGGGGTLYQVATNGANFVVLKNFTNAVNGANPLGQLYTDGSSLYGVANALGPGGSGLVYQFWLAPVITGQPQNLTVTNGNNASFTATASDENPLTYQWYFNTNTPLAGQNASTLNLTGVTSNNAGVYTLVVSNYSGSVTSSPAVLTVIAIGGLPMITAQPQNLTVTNGHSATFTITATNNGGGALSYQWYFNTNTPISGQTGNQYTLGSAQAANAGAYTVVVSNLFGAVTSSPAILTVVGPPGINGQPQNLTVTNGNSATFTVSATNISGTLKYQWYFNTNTAIAGQTASSYTIPSVQATNAGAYTVVVSNLFGAVTSSPAILTVFAPPLITAQPQNLSLTNGNNATFTVTAFSSTGPMNYQWYYNTNTPIDGQTGSAYNIPLVLITNAGTYSVVVSNSFGAVTSAPALLSISTNSKPYILSQSPSQFVTNGSMAFFSVTVSGQPFLGYQWYTNLTGTQQGTPFALKTNSLCTIFNTTNRIFWYYCVITNSLGAATSNPALLTVITNPIIVSNPQPVTVAVGSPVNFSVTAWGAGLGFQWYSNSVNTAIGARLTGQTASTYSFTAITNANGAYYSVVVTNLYGAATSTPPARLTVSSLPYITLQPIGGLVTNGSSLTFTSTAAGPGPLSYQWLLNTNQSVLNATNTTLTVTESNSPGYYSMRVTNLYGAATSSPALLTILSLPYITLQPLGATITNGSSVTFTSSAAGLGTLGYQWLYQTNILITGATSTSLTFATANQPGAYSMKVTNLYGAATSTPALLNVLGRPVTLASAFDPASGSFAFTYANLAGSTNRLLATTNLANPAAWQAIATNIMATNGLWFFTDTNSAQTNTLRLYRFVSP